MYFEYVLKWSHAWARQGRACKIWDQSHRGGGVESVGGWGVSITPIHHVMLTLYQIVFGFVLIFKCDVLMFLLIVFHTITKHQNKWRNDEANRLVSSINKPFFLNMIVLFD